MSDYDLVSSVGKPSREQDRQKTLMRNIVVRIATLRFEYNSRLGIPYWGRPGIDLIDRLNSLLFLDRDDVTDVCNIVTHTLYDCLKRALNPPTNDRSEPPFFNHG